MKRMVMAVIMIVSVIVVVMITVIVFVIRLVRFGLTAVVPDQADAEHPRHDGRDKADDRTDHGGNESEKGVGDENGVRPGFRRRDQEGHAGRTGSALSAHFGDDGNDRATAEWNRYPDGGTDADRPNAVVVEPSENRFPGNEHVDQAGKQQTQDQHRSQQQERRPDEIDVRGKDVSYGIYDHLTVSRRSLVRAKYTTT